MMPFELDVLERLDRLTEKTEALGIAFATHCAVEEAASKRRASRVPVIAAIAACVSSAVALGTLFWR